MRYLFPVLLIAAASCDRTGADQSVRVDTVRVIDSSATPPAAAKPTPPPPIDQVIADVSREIKAEGYAVYPFEVPAGRTMCGLNAKVLGISGGEKDVEVYILPDARYQEWVQDPTAEPAALRAMEWSIIAATSPLDLSAGRYYFVVSNRFSAFTPKAVQIFASLYCP
jgi:hypothetical protein